MITSGCTATLGLYDNASEIRKKADITYVDNKVDPLQAGHKGYATLAQAQVAQSGLAANTVVEVLSDTAEANNGYYLWNGTTLTKTAFSPLVQANNYTDSKVATAKAEAIATAASDATTKSNAAISTASSDATTKSNNAVTTANNYTDSRYNSLVVETEQFANQAEAAATAANIAGKVYATTSEGVASGTGVPSGQYFNVRSSSNDNYIDEYLNNGGVAQATGKSYPSSTYVQDIENYVAKPFINGKTYTLDKRVQLSKGDIVKSTIDGNTNDPNEDMTGWEFDNSPNSIITVNSVAEMLTLQAFNGRTVKTKSYNTPNLTLANPYHGGMTYIYDSSKSAQNDGGSVIDGWVALFPVNQVVNVDWFGADPTNTIDSTSAVLATIQYACGDLTSNFKAGVTKRAVIEYSAGIYKQGDVPIISCCTYKGRGKFSTQIIPSDTAQWVFKSVGSYEGAVISGDTRVIYSSIKEMTIGYGYVSSVPRVNNSAGGIYREAGSWNQIENVAILGLGGNGLKLIGDFDSDFNYLTIMAVGSSGFPALVIDRSLGSNDGSNAMSFRRLHMEGCYQDFYIGRNSRHIWFDWAKFESCSVSSVIEDNQGIIFDNLECSVLHTDFPWINVIASSGYSPFVVEFNNPSLIGVGWFINNTTNFKVKITGGSGRRVTKLATGKHLIVDGIYMYDCGAQLMTLGFSTIKNCNFIAQKLTSTTDGTADVIILTDSGNKVVDCEFTGQGSNSDGVAFINITASTTSKIIGNGFGAGKQYGIRGSANINQRDNNYTNTAFTGTNVNYTSLVNTNNIGFDSKGGTKSVFSVVDANTTVGIENIISGASILSIRDSNFALIGIVFADSTGRLSIVAQNGTQTALAGSGTSGDGKIYLRASGTTLVVENRNTSQLRLTVLAQSAV